MFVVDYQRDIFMKIGGVIHRKRGVTDSLCTVTKEFSEFL